MTATTEPQESAQAQSPLVMWNEQVQALVAPEHADAAINTIHQNLMGLHAKLVKGGNEAAAAKVEDAYNQAIAIYNMTTQQGVVIAGGAAAIEAAEEQRNEAVTELQELLTAIDDMDESHPKLAEYTEAIQDYAMNLAHETITEDVEEYIADFWSVDFHHATAIWMAVLGRADLRADQKKLFRAFIDSLVQDGEDQDADGDE